MPDPFIRRLRDPNISFEEKDELRRKLAQKYAIQTGRPIEASISEFRNKLFEPELFEPKKFKPKLLTGPSRELERLRKKTSKNLMSPKEMLELLDEST